MTGIQTWERVIPVEDREYQIIERYNLDLLERVRKVKRMKERLQSMPYDIQTLQKEIWEDTKRQAALVQLCLKGCDWLSDEGVCVSSTGCMYGCQKST